MYLFSKFSPMNPWILLFAFASIRALADAKVAGQGVLYFDAADFIELPRVVYGENMTYPLDILPVYTENQSVNMRLYMGSDASASASISRFSISGFLRSLSEASNSIRVERDVPENLSIFKEIDLGGLRSGVYLLSVLDNRSLLISIPLIVVRSETALEIPQNVTAGDFLEADVSMDGLGNMSKIFGVCMISVEDYRDMELVIGDDSINVSFENRSAMLPIARPSVPALMEMLDVLPQDGAAGVQESNESSADVLLMTSSESEGGTYIVTAAVYAPGRGLVGLKQGRIEVLPAAL